jgi:6-phosphofructokinase 1
MAFDRLLATRLGAAAVRELHEGNHGQIVGLIGNEIVRTPLEDVFTSHKQLDLSLCELGRIMEK